MAFVSQPSRLLAKLRMACVKVPGKSNHSVNSEKGRVSPSGISNECKTCKRNESYHPASDRERTAEQRSSTGPGQSGGTLGEGPEWESGPAGLFVSALGIRTQGDPAPRGHWVMPGTSVVVTTGGCSWHRVGGGRDAAQHLQCPELPHKE